jgi:hypothetical protein
MSTLIQGFDQNLANTYLLQNLSKRPITEQTPPANVPLLPSGSTWESLIAQTEREIQEAKDNAFGRRIRDTIARLHAGAITLTRYHFWQDYSKIPANDLSSRTLRYAALLIKLDYIDKKIAEQVEWNNNVIIKFFTDMGYHFIDSTRTLVGVGETVVEGVEKVAQNADKIVPEVENALFYAAIAGGSILTLMLLSNLKK